MSMKQDGEGSADRREPASTYARAVLGERYVRDIRNLVTLMQLDAGVIERAVALPRDPKDVRGV